MKDARPFKGSSLALSCTVAKPKDEVSKSSSSCRENATVAMTRSGYTLLPNWQNNPDAVPLAFEINNRGDVEPFVPPVGFSLLGGKLMTFQAHGEVFTSDTRDSNALVEFLEEHSDSVEDSFRLRQRLGTNIRLLGTDHKTGKVVPWIKNEMGPVFYLDVLGNLSRQLTA